MSRRIINSDRRDPSRIRKKAELGLSRVDNIGASELLSLAKDLFKNEVYRGDLYASTEIKENIAFELPLCEFTSNSTRFSVTVSFIGGNNVVSVVKANILHTFDQYSVDDAFSIEFENSGLVVNSISSSIFFSLYSRSKEAVLSLNVGSNLKTVHNVDSISYYFSDYVVFSTGSAEQLGFTPIEPRIRIGSDKGTYLSGNGVTRQDYYCRDGNRKQATFAKSLAVYNSSGHIISEETINASSSSNQYDFPKINNKVFTGSKKILVDGESTRDITIYAKHGEGEVRSDVAGNHHWDVLSAIPKVGYKSSTRSTTQPTTARPTTRPTTPIATPTPNITSTFFPTTTTSFAPTYSPTPTNTPSGQGRSVDMNMMMRSGSYTQQSTTLANTSSTPTPINTTTLSPTTPRPTNNSLRVRSYIYDMAENLIKTGNTEIIIDNNDSTYYQICFISFDEIAKDGDLTFNKLEVFNENDRHNSAFENDLANISGNPNKSIQIKTETKNHSLQIKNCRYLRDDLGANVTIKVYLKYYSKPTTTKAPITSPGKGDKENDVTNSIYEPVIDPNSTIGHYAAVDLVDRALSADGGLCTLVDIPSLPEEINSFYGAIKTLQNYAKQTSQYNNEHVVSIGFLRNYTECLYHTLNFLVEAFSSLDQLRHLSEQIWFYKIELDDSNIPIKKGPEVDLISLPAAPNKLDTFDIGFSIKNFEFKENETKVLTISCSETGNSSFRISYFSFNKNQWYDLDSPFRSSQSININNYNKDYIFRIRIRSEKDIYLNQNVLGKKDNITVIFNNKVYNQKLITLSDNFQPDSAFRRAIGNNSSYIFPVTIYSAGYISATEDNPSSVVFRKFHTSGNNNSSKNYCYYTTNFDCYDSLSLTTGSPTSGLIWHGITRNTENSGDYNVSVLMPPKKDHTNYLCLQGLAMMKDLKVDVQSNAFKIRIFTSRMTSSNSQSPSKQWSDLLPNSTWNNSISLWSGNSADNYEFTEILHSTLNSQNDAITSDKVLPEQFFIQIIPERDRTELTDVESVGTIVFSSKNNPDQVYMTINVGQRGKMMDISTDNSINSTIFGKNNVIFYKSEGNTSDFYGYIACSLGNISNEEFDLLSHGVDILNSSGTVLNGFKATLKHWEDIEYFQYRDYGSYRFTKDLSAMAKLPEEKGFNSINGTNSLYFIEISTNRADFTTAASKFKLSTIDEYRKKILNKTYYPEIDLLSANTSHTTSFVKAASFTISPYVYPTVNFNALVLSGKAQQNSITSSISTSNRSLLEFIEEPLYYYSKNDFSENISFFEEISKITLELPKNIVELINISSSNLVYKVFNDITYVNSDGNQRTRYNDYLYETDQSPLTGNNIIFNLINENDVINLEGNSVRAIKIESRIALFKSYGNNEYEMIHTSRGSNVINVRIDLSLNGLESSVYSRLFEDE